MGHRRRINISRTEDEISVLGTFNIVPTAVWPRAYDRRADCSYSRIPSWRVTLLCTSYEYLSLYTSRGARMGDPDSHTRHKYINSCSRIIIRTIYAHNNTTTNNVSMFDLLFNKLSSELCITSALLMSDEMHLIHVGVHFGSEITNLNRYIVKHSTTVFYWELPQRSTKKSPSTSDKNSESDRTSQSSDIPSSRRNINNFNQHFSSVNQSKHFAASSKLFFYYYTVIHVEYARRVVV